MKYPAKYERQLPKVIEGSELVPFGPENQIEARGEDLARRDRVKALNRAVKTLKSREQDVLRLRVKYGFTLKETSEALFITQERAQVAEVGAIRKLRHPARRLREVA